MTTREEISTMLETMGFETNYIDRAFRVYIKNYGHSYNVEVITEIIVRLMNKDKLKYKDLNAFKKIIFDKLQWSWTKYESQAISFYECIATEVYGKSTDFDKVKKEIWRYVKKNADFFMKMYKKNASLNFNMQYGDFKLVLGQMENAGAPFQTSTCRLCMIAASELYNVRIVLFEYDEDAKRIVPTFKCYVDRKNIPIILLAKTETMRHHTFYIIHDLNDIAFASPPANNFDSYVDCLNQMQPEITQISAYCNHLMIQTFGYSQGLPEDIYELIKRFMPKINARPIGWKKEAFEDELMILLRVAAGYYT